VLRIWRWGGQCIGRWGIKTVKTLKFGKGGGAWPPPLYLWWRRPCQCVITSPSRHPPPLFTILNVFTQYSTSRKLLAFDNIFRQSTPNLLHPLNVQNCDSWFLGLEIFTKFDFVCISFRSKIINQEIALPSQLFTANVLFRYFKLNYQRIYVIICNYINCILASSLIFFISKNYILNYCWLQTRPKVWFRS